jgi:hypothetical protein
MAHSVRKPEITPHYIANPIGTFVSKCAALSGIPGFSPCGCLGYHRISTRDPMEMYRLSVPAPGGIERSNRYGSLGYYHMSSRGAIEMHLSGCTYSQRYSGITHKFELLRSCHAELH